MVWSRRGGYSGGLRWSAGGATNVTRWGRPEQRPEDRTRAQRMGEADGGAETSTDDGAHDGPEHRADKQTLQLNESITAKLNRPRSTQHAVRRRPAGSPQRQLQSHACLHHTTTTATARSELPPGVCVAFPSPPSMCFVFLLARPRKTSASRSPLRLHLHLSSLLALFLPLSHTSLSPSLPLFLAHHCLTRSLLRLSTPLPLGVKAQTSIQSTSPTYKTGQRQYPLPYSLGDRRPCTGICPPPIQISRTPQPAVMLV